MILIDYSQVAISNIMSFKQDLIQAQMTGDTKGSEDIIRHCILSSLKMYKKRFGKEYGDVIVCCDSYNYWRKDYHPFYKSKRAGSREEDDMPWDVLFTIMSKVRDEIAEHSPYKVMRIDRCEADDVIGVLCEHTNEFGNHEPVMIVSSDKDFKQLQKFDNVKQFSPMQKKFVTFAKGETVKEFTTMHIVKGDTGDGVPNIFSPDDIFHQDGVRQKPVTKKILEEFYTYGRDACKTDQERERWDRNETCISLSHIPEEYKKAISDEYLNNKANGDKMSLYNYLMENRCNLLLEEIEDF